MNLRFFGIFLVLLISSGCLKASHDPVAEDLDFKVTKVGYDIVMAEVIQPYCLECHGANEPPYLNTFAQVKNAIPGIRFTVFETQDPNLMMPPKQNLSIRAKRTLKAWIDFDAPQKTVPVGDDYDPDQPPKNPGDDDFDFNVGWLEVKEKVLDQACNRCHFTGNKWNLQDYTIYENVRSDFNTILNTSVIAEINFMPPRSRPPDILPPNWLEDQADSFDPNPNELSLEEKSILLIWLANDLREN